MEPENDALYREIRRPSLIGNWCVHHLGTSYEVSGGCPRCRAETRGDPKNDIEIRACDGELRVESRGVAKVIRGYAVVFNRLSETLGFFREKIDPAAVDRSLKEGTDLRALVDHDTARILGRLSAGTLRVEKDGHGLLVEVDPPETTAGQDIVESIRRRDVTGMSFAFRTLKDQWDETVDPPVRTVLDMVMREVSIVTFPAYPQTEVALRSLEGQRRSSRGRPVGLQERMRWTSQKLS